MYFNFFLYNLIYILDRIIDHYKIKNRLENEYEKISNYSRQCI